MAPTPAPLAGTVVEVVDGDTVRVELPSGLETVRIIGIDTPEVVHPTEPEACYGAEATAFAKRTLDGQPVTLELDPTQDERDRYDRLLAHVHVGDGLYAADAIAAGYGIHYVYERPSIHAAELDAAADAARTAKAGIWASCKGRVDLPALPLVVPAPVDEPDPEPPADSRLPSLLRSLRPGRRGRPRLRRHRLPGRGHRSRRLPPRRLGQRRPGLRELLMTGAGPATLTQGEILSMSC